MHPHNSICHDLNPQADKLLRGLQQILSGELNEIWLVGGTIRDLLEGYSPKDFDFAFSGDFTKKIKRWAGQMRGHWFWLDKERNQSRVIFPQEGLQFDFAPLRAEHITLDLELRDFTVNAMALTFSNLLLGNSTLIDPLKGRQDLERGVLRCCGETVLLSDPLRILKGLRHHSLRGWQFDPRTILLMTEAAPGLSVVAGERLRNELGQIFNSNRVSSAAGLMAEFTILDNLFPGIAKDGLEGELSAISQRLDQLAALPYIASILDTSVEEGITCRSLVYLAAILRRVEPLTNIGLITQRLRLSTRSQTILQSLCSEAVLLDGFKASDSPRIAALKLESLGNNCYEKILFALVQRNNATMDLLFEDFFPAYAQLLHRGRIDDLLNGGEISSLTGLPSGQPIGDYQRRIKAAEIAGEITDKTSAERWLKCQFSD
jgi:hypothetical protein